MTQHVIVTDIRSLVSMTKRSIVKVYRWTYMADMKVAVYAKIANTIPKESIVINANRNSIDHMENIGMKPMCAEVSDPLSFDPICVCVCFCLQLHNLINFLFITDFDSM